MFKNLILLIQTVLAFAYCFRFGYILTGYGHGGQLLGIPFAIVMLLILVYFLSQKPGIRKNRAFILGTAYFLALAGFSATIEIIRATNANYFEFLYVEPGGYAGRIFMGWVCVGVISFILIRRKISKL